MLLVIIKLKKRKKKANYLSTLVGGNFVSSGTIYTCNSSLTNPRLGPFSK